MFNLQLPKRFPRNFFFKASGLALLSAITLFSCKEECSLADEIETNDYLLDEYAFFDPTDTLNVSVCDAEDIATLFMDKVGGIDNTFKSSGLHYSSRKTDVIPDDNMEPAIYVVNLEPEGFCVVSATKKTESILAYSDQGNFDLNNLPDGLAEWLSENVELIQFIRSCEPEGQMVPAVAVLGSGSGCGGNSSNGGGTNTGTKIDTETYGPLLKTEWGQDYPFNIMCPDNNCYNGDENCLAGCVAIAAAQIVRYYQPIMVYNFNPYYWNDMPNKKYPIKSDEFIRKDRGYLSMARLIHDIGVAVDMDYGCEGSRAEMEKIPGVLSNKFGFYYGGNYQELSNSKASPKLIDNIKHKQPVIMSGYRTKKLLGLVYRNRHAWVCDGYKKITHKKGNNVTGTEEYFHMNWGWGGKDNGWFTLDLKLYQSDNGYDENKGYIYKKSYITGIKYNPNSNL